MQKNSTAATVQAPPEIVPPRLAAKFEPEILRLPKPGLLCPLTGLSRSAVNELILPTPRNGHKPPVRSFCLRQRGAKTGIRLVNYASLADFIRQHAEGATR